MLTVYVVCLSLVAMYTVNNQHYILCSGLMALIASVVLYVMAFADRKVVTRAIAGLGFICMCGTALVFLFMGNENAVFLEYMFAGSSHGFDLRWAVISAAVLGLVVGYICYYFAVHCNNAHWVITALFVVGMLAARTMGSLPPYIIIVVIVSYLLVLGVSNTSRFVYVQALNVYGMRYAVAAFLVVISLIVALLIPKSASMSGKELINEIVLGMGGYNYNVSTFHQSSSVNDGNNHWLDRELFRVRADEPVNLIYGCFDEYNGEQGWTTTNYYNKGYPDWGYSEMNIGSMINRMRDAAEDGMLKEYADKLKDIPVSATRTSNMQVEHSPDLHSQVVLHPVGTYNVSILNDDAASNKRTKVFATPRHELFVNNGIIGLEYDVHYYSSDINAKFVRSFTSDELESLLRAASNEGVISQVAVEMFLDDMREAKYYQELTASKGMSNEIKELAEDITSGADTDYDKLMRIMRWFEREDFVYDLNYVPKEFTVEHFVFESKRGICSDYATAATLLCRGAGLAAIYSEGYAMDVDGRTQEGEYIITDANAHAFVQVYITGHGWYCLDATSFAEPVEVQEMPTDLLASVLICIIVLVVLVLAIYLLRGRITDIWFSVSYRIMAPEHAVRGILVRIRREAGRIAGCNADTMTAQDTSRVIYGIGLRMEAQRFMSACDRVSYGAGDTNKTEPPILYKDYKTLKAVRRQKK